MSIGTLIVVSMATVAFTGGACVMYQEIAFNNDGVGEKTCRTHAEQYVKTDNNVAQGRIFACSDSHGKITQRFVAYQR